MLFMAVILSAQVRVTTTDRLFVREKAQIGTDTSKYFQTITDSISASSTHRQAPTAKAVYNLVSTSGDGDKGDIDVASSGAVWTVDTGSITTVKIAANAVTVTEIANSAVTYAKMQDVSATDRLLGRDSGGSGSVEEISVGGGLEFSGSGSIRIAQQSATSGQVLKWNGTTWAPDDDATSAGATGHNIAENGTGVTQRDTLNFSDDQIDFTVSSTATSTDVSGKIAQGGATSGQVLKWNGSAWAPADDLIGTDTSGYNQSLSFSGDTIYLTDGNSTLNAKLSGVILQDGNNFGSGVVIGTNDTNNVTIETGGLPRVVVSDDGTYSGKLTVTSTTPDTNIVYNTLSVAGKTSGQADAFFGTGLEFYLDDSSGVSKKTGNITSYWTDVTSSAEYSAMNFSGMDNGSAASYLTLTKNKMLGSFASTWTISNSSAALVLGGDSGAVTVGGSSGAVTLSTSKTTTPITLTSSGAMTNGLGGVTIGSTSLTSPSLSKKSLRIAESYAPASGSGSLYSLAIEPTINLQNTASGTQYGLYINPTLTSLNTGGAYRALEITANGTAVKGIYQTGTSATNNLAGSTGIGSTSAPARTLDVAGELRVSDLTTDIPSVIVGADVDGDFAKITVGSGLSLTNDTLISTASGADGNGIYDGNGTVPASTTATLAGTLSFDNAASYTLNIGDVGAADAGVGIKVDASYARLGNVHGADNSYVISGAGGNYIRTDASNLQQTSSGTSWNILTGDLKFVDDRGTKKGIEYSADYSAGILANARSIPDVGIVQGLISDSLATVGGGISDGDKGDIDVTSSGAVWTVDTAAITDVKVSDVSVSKLTSGNLAAGLAATLPNTSTTARINYNNSNSALLIDDANNGTSVSSEDGTNYIYAANDEVSVVFSPIPGINQTASGIKIYLTANENQAFGDLCYIDSDGEAHLGDADTITMSRITVMCLGSVSASGTGTYLVSGVSRDDSWSLTVGAQVYLSTTGTTGNTITQTAPSGTNDCVTVIGVATHANRILFNPSPLVIELN